MKILMVCLGNICRSPLADGMLRHKVEQNGLKVIVDSAGTSGFHIGEAPDSRMRATARNYGLSIDNLKSRQFIAQDFKEFDKIYAMDSSNYKNMVALAESKEEEDKVELILNEAHPGMDLAVPDPYYGGDRGFTEVYELLDQATDKIIEKLKNNE